MITRLFMPSQSRTCVELALIAVWLLAGLHVRRIGSDPAASEAARRQDTRASRSRSTRLKPDASSTFAGAPDWMAIDEDVWVSN